MVLYRLKSSRKRLSEKIDRGKKYLEKGKETYEVDELLKFKNAIEKEKSRYKNYLEEYRKTDEKDEKIIIEFEDFLLKGEDLITDELKHHIEVLAEARDREHKLLLQKMDDEIRLIREIGRLEIEELRSEIGSIEEGEIKQKINELENELESTKNEIKKIKTERQNRLESQKKTKYQETKMEAKEEKKIENQNENENETKIENKEEIKIKDDNETKIEVENETEMKSDNERKPDTGNESKSQFESEKINRKEIELLDSDNGKEFGNFEPVLERPLLVFQNADKSDETEPPSSFEKFNLTDTLPKQIASYTMKTFNVEAYRNDVTESKAIVTQRVPFTLNSKFELIEHERENLTLHQTNVLPKALCYRGIKKYFQAEHKEKDTNNYNDFRKPAVKALKSTVERTEVKYQMKWSWQRRKRGREQSSRRRECREHSRDY